MKNILISFFIFTAICSQSFADDSAEISTSLTRHARYLIENGKISEAITELSQALLIDPENNFAAEQLITLFDNLPTPSQQKFDILLFRDLTSHLQHLKENNAYFQDKIVKMQAYLTQRGLTEADLTSELKKIHIESSLKTETPQPSLNEAIETPLKNVICNLQITAESIRKNIRLSRMQFNHLRLLNHRLTEMPLPGKVYYNVPIVVTSDIDTVDPAAISVLKRQVAVIQKQIFTLKDDLQAKDEKISALSSELIEFALKVKEHESILVQKTSSIAALDEELAELKSRIELNQQLVTNKDKNMLELQREMDGLKTTLLAQTKNLQKDISVKERELRESQGLINVYQEQMKTAKSTISNKEADITTLEEQLELVQNKLYQKDEALKEADEKITTLQTALEKLQKKCEKGLSLYSPNQIIDLADNLVKLSTDLQAINNSMSEEIKAFKEITSLVNSIGL